MLPSIWHFFKLWFPAQLSSISHHVWINISCLAIGFHHVLSGALSAYDDCLSNSQIQNPKGQVLKTILLHLHNKQEDFICWHFRYPTAPFLFYLPQNNNFLFFLCEVSVPENKQTRVCSVCSPKHNCKKAEGYKSDFLCFTDRYISLAYLYVGWDFGYTKAILGPWKIRKVYFSGKTRVGQCAINCYGCSRARGLIRWEMPARIIWTSHFQGSRRWLTIPALEKKFLSKWAAQKQSHNPH